ncbi:MAG TPA: hypothetical protein VFH10_11055 [Nocardioides sp.]|uniref:NADase-type glycan-binding domain-containing protein n=1 Tax=Nocardioides sp. TaxID=35761 RepID=UPI002D7EDC48|nr:hypothetical protein [Nocardioides sp.]HET6653169.1 hypothetical protein [Nocardioides sp.]
MPDSRTPGGLPPDLPPEYAEAYRRGYERAYREAIGREADTDPTVDTEAPVVEPVETSAPKHLAPAPVVEPEPPVVEPVEAGPPPVEDPDQPIRIRGPLFADEADEADEARADNEHTQVLNLHDQRPSQVSHEAVFAPHPLAFDDDTAPEPPRPDGGPEPETDTGRHRWSGGLADDLVADDYQEAEPRRTRPGWLVPALLGGLVLILVLSAYGIGKVFSSSVDGADVSTEAPDGVVLGDDGEGAANAGNGKGKPRNQQKGAYQGVTDQAVVGGASASCEAPASVDAAGNQIAYPPTNVYDGDMTTAWRCNGRGVGQSLTLTLAEAGRIGEVGLVPGYAKTDPRSGVDRYAENNRLTRVRWTFADGTSVVQGVDGAEANRSLQTMRIPVTESDTVVLEVLASTPGPRNTMAVSEVRVGQASE